MISIERAIHVIIILTEKTKETLREEYLNKAQLVHMQMEQWLFQRKKLLAEAEKRSADGLRLVQEHLEKEEQGLRDKLSTLQFQLEQLDKLPEGSELHYQTLKSFVPVQVGDVWKERVGEAEIVIKDGIVVEIRQGGSK
ncbi:YlqD family protein [Brevibacillus daliensis]|uniref:YlqD family protein n=1 Tax=Brevibacillus daliensis TaxID=2892995 RepID=UPI001E2F6533|nr:YlqD family protein [Brevibacillus daliensis]